MLLLLTTLLVVVVVAAVLAVVAAPCFVEYEPCCCRNRRHPTVRPKRATLHRRVRLRLVGPPAGPVAAKTGKTNRIRARRRLARVVTVVLAWTLVLVAAVDFAYQ